MLVFETENSIAFDVDDTLIMWDCSETPAVDTMMIKCPYDGSSRQFRPHKEHITFLKKCFGRDIKVIVWSSGGYLWAKTVVEALGLQDCVDLIMTKPNKLVDDLPSAEIFPTRIYLHE